MPDDQNFDAIYISIGNSDNKLSQKDWIQLIRQVKMSVRDYQPVQIYGEWYSAPDSQFQNACFAFSKGTRLRQQTNLAAFTKLCQEMALIAQHYSQDAITVATAQTAFISAPKEDG